MEVEDYLCDCGQVYESENYLGEKFCPVCDDVESRKKLTRVVLHHTARILRASSKEREPGEVRFDRMEHLSRQARRHAEANNLLDLEEE